MRRGIITAGVLIAGGAVAAAAARRAMHDHMAEGTFPGRTGSRVNSYLAKPMYRLMAGVLAVGPEDDLLDVACGWGEFLAAHATRARNVAGIDWSEEKVGLARQRLADRIVEGTAQVAHGDAANLPWADGTFSAATCMAAFPFFPDPARVMSEILRVLRPGGRVVMQVGMRWPDGPPKHMPALLSQVVDLSDEAAVQKVFEDAGFGGVSMSYGPASASSLRRMVNRTVARSDDLRVIRAVKPATGPDR
jgi:SAM-dependent methyltransferase